MDPWLHLSDFEIGQLFRHYELLQLWNQRMNLTTVRPGPETVIRHYCESLFFATHLPAGNNQISLYDLGSGAGFPGFPIAVLKPNWQVTLVESSQRKAVFLRESTRQLRNVKVLAERMEDISEQADWAISRAVDARFVLATVPRIARSVGLMVGEDEFLAIGKDSPIAWAAPVRLPWGDRTMCLYGSCEA
jgi:16S rRNA (guanine(527)-N(7))-methyltransferase RsmG